MKILFVIDMYDNMSNKMCYFARAMAEALRALGHTVTILSTGKSDDQKIILARGGNDFLLKNSSENKDLVFAKAEEKVIKRAFKSPDIIHFFMPSKMSKVALEIAQDMKIPTTATFSVNPELIAENLGFKKNKFITKFLYNKYKEFYDDFNSINVSTLYEANKLKEYGYDAETTIIPRGIGDEYSYKKTEKPFDLREKIVITMVGAIEKKYGQAKIIEALTKSKYKDYLYLILAGDGDDKKTVKELLDKNQIGNTVNLFDKKELIEVLSYTDLFIDLPKDVNDEVACTQAMAIGNVPLLSKDNEIAMAEFELDDRFTYDLENESDLADKVDYWIEHQTELRKYRLEFSKAVEKYRLKFSAYKFEKMLQNEVQHTTSKLNVI